MKQYIALILFIPQLLFAQYQSKEFMLPVERNTSCQVIGLTTTQDSIVALNINQSVSGFFISGTTSFENSQDSYARVTIKDINDVEYLVYENYPLLSGKNRSRFSKVAIESMLLDDITPTSMKIEVCNAYIKIDSIYLSAAQNLKSSFLPKAKTIRQEQTQVLVDKLNEQLRENHLPWYAGCTSIALKTFEEKKELFGPKVPCLFGFDCYKDGVYVTNPIQATQEETWNTKSQSPRNISFVKDFDWRNRHGKNWITSVKIQIRNTCWAFATVATIESNFNIYFNQIFENDTINNLSEQELVSCLDNDSLDVSYRYYEGGFTMWALDYVQRKGIVREDFFPFTGTPSCDEKGDNPEEQVSFSSFRNLYMNHHLVVEAFFYNDNVADTLRMSVIKSPVVLDYIKYGSGHSVSCVGFHQIQMGDTLCSNCSNNSANLFVVDNSSEYLVDKISWIIKNNWGENWGINGFAKVILDNAQLRLYEINPPFTSLIYPDSSRCVTDEDMDGYYTWGSGSRPANLPEWIPTEQDGNDTNPLVGPIDEYGNCDTLYVNPTNTWYIDSIANYNVSSHFTCPNIVVMEDGTLTITASTLMMREDTTIRVQNGGKLVIDGGQINDANIVIENGGTLIIDHNGLILLRHNGQYLTQIGAKVLINSGKIEYQH